MANLDQYLGETRGRGAEVARRAGISRGTLSSIRSGLRRPSLDVAKRIERATGGEVSAASLLGLSGESAPPPRDLGDGRWVVYPDADGRLTLTPEMVAALGFPTGERLMFRPGTDGVTVISPTQALKAIQVEVAKLPDKGVSMVDELIAERRAAAARGE